MSAAVVHSAVTTPSAVTPPVSMPNLGSMLTSVYEASQSGASATSLAAQFPTLQFKGTSVDIHVLISGNLTTTLSSLTSLGFQTLDSSATYGAADGYAPISALPQISALVRSGTPNYKPVLNSFSFSGAVETSTPAPKAITVVAKPAPVVVVSAPVKPAVTLTTIHDLALERL